MGLHVSHDCWNSSYNEFRRFRRAIAEAIGIDLLQMQGFTKDGEEGVPWESISPSDVHFLLHHSDCDGSIRYPDARKLADALEALLLVSALEEFSPVGTRRGLGGWENTVRKWIDGCRRAYKERRKITFG